MLKYKGYTGNVVYDDEFAIFHDEVLDTRDVITFQGDECKRNREGFSRFNK